MDKQYPEHWDLAASIVHGRFPSQFAIDHPNHQQREIIAAKAQIGPTVTAWQYGKENISVTVDGITAHQVRHKCTLGLS